MHKTIQTANRVLRRLPTLVLVAGAAVVLAVAAPGTAGARPTRGKARGPGPKVGVLTFTGPGEAASRGAVEGALRSRTIVVVPGAELLAAAKNAHVKLNGDDGFKAVSKALNLTAIVAGEVSKKKATVVVRTGDDGTVVGEETFQGADPRKVATTIHRTFWKRLSGAFNKTKPPTGGAFEAPPPVEEPEATGGEAGEAASEPPARAAREERKEDRKSEATEEKSESKAEKTEKTESASKETAEGETAPGSSEALDISVGPAWFMRSLSFNQPRNDLSNTKVASYSLPRAPALVLGAEIYPAALAGVSGFAADLGLTVDASYLLPVVKSKGADGGEYNTTGLAYALGVKVRLPAGLFIAASYGDQSFKLTKSNAGMADPVVPGVEYKFARVGAGIRDYVTPSLMLQAHAAYLACLGTPGGDISSKNYFPRAKCNGFEAGVGAGYRLADQWEIRAGVDWRRFGMDFHVKTTDVQNDPGSTPAIAGGAVDQYIQITAAIAYVFGGGSSDGAHAAEPSGGAEKPAKSDAKSDDDGDNDSEGGE